MSTISRSKIALWVDSALVSKRGQSPTDWATTEQVCKAARRVRSTIYMWLQREVLPQPQVVHSGRHGTSARWPIHAPAQARWIAEKLESGYTFEEIRAALARGEFTPG